ncbi:hypothetical protein ACROYT_G014923 [Oculina patagonica]
MLHNAAAKGATAFANATGFDLEDYCVDLFYWFDKSTMRKGILKEYCMFCDTEYEAVVNFLQREDPLIHLLHIQMENSLNKLAVKFTRPEKVMEHKPKFGTLKGLDISLENQKTDENLSVGLVTKGQLRKLLNEADIDSRDVDKFYDGVRQFYIAAFTYCTKW